MAKQTEEKRVLIDDGFDSATEFDMTAYDDGTFELGFFRSGEDPFGEDTYYTGNITAESVERVRDQLTDFLEKNRL